MSHFGALLVYLAGGMFLVLLFWINDNVEEAITCIGFAFVLFAISAVLEEIDKSQKQIRKLNDAMRVHPIPLRKENVSYG